MTAVQTRNGKRAKRDRVNRVADDIVSANSLATHLGCTRQNIAWLTAEAVIERRGDGLYDQAASRLKYIKHLRTSSRTVRSAADAEHVHAKAQMLQIKIMQQQRKLVLREDANALIDEICGIVLMNMSGIGAECSNGDLRVRRHIDAVVHRTRIAIAQVGARMADERNEPRSSIALRDSLLTIVALTSRTLVGGFNRSVQHPAQGLPRA